MTEQKQLKSLGIAAGVEGDMVLIQTERTFMLCTPREIEQFHAHLREAYRGAQRTAKLNALGTAR